MPLSDIEIAQRATLRRITDLARDRLGIADAQLVPYGHDKAKIDLGYLASLRDRPDGKLVLVTAITPRRPERARPPRRWAWATH